MNLFDLCCDSLVRTIQTGIKKSSNKIGIELEIFVLHKQGDIDIFNLKKYQKLIHDYFSNKYNNDFYDNSKDEVIFVINKIGTITFEPGGQMEISTICFYRLNDLIITVSLFLNELEKHVSKYGYSFYFSGYQPQRIDLRNKKRRYVNMYDYFNDFGKQMMTQTASLQVNLDYGKDDIFCLRWRAVHAIIPHCIFLFSNSYNKEFHSYRMHIWTQLDQTRVAGYYNPLKSQSINDIAAHYCTKALNVYRITAEENIEEFKNSEVVGKNINSSEILHIWKNHLSTIFSYVRLREYFELRFIDCPTRLDIFYPAIIMWAIIYNDAAVCWILKHFTFEQKAIEPAILGECSYHFKNQIDQLLVLTKECIDDLSEDILSTEYKIKTKQYLTERILASNHLRNNKKGVSII